MFVLLFQYRSLEWLTQGTKNGVWAKQLPCSVDDVDTAVSLDNVTDFSNLKA